MFGLFPLRGHRDALLPSALLARILVLTLHVLLVVVERSRVAHRPGVRIARIVQASSLTDEPVVGEFPVHLGVCRLGHAGLLRPCIPVRL